MSPAPVDDAAEQPEGRRPDTPATTSAPVRPRLRVVRGDATPEEIAAMIVALSVRVPPPAGPPKLARSGWSSYAHQVRWPLHWSGHGWRTHARPR